MQTLAPNTAAATAHITLPVARATTLEVTATDPAGNVGTQNVTITP